jgi:DNA-binding PadR family transcriptional regulator
MGEHGPVSEQLFHILLSLVDEPKHGYGIIQEVERRTKGEVTLGASTLYSAIKRIRSWRWVEEVEAPDSGEDPRRRYYGLTGEGRRAVRSEAKRLEDLVRYARAKDVLRRTPT